MPGPKSTPVIRDGNGKPIAVGKTAVVRAKRGKR